VRCIVNWSECRAFCGQVDIKKDSLVELMFSGQFDGLQTDPILKSDGRRMSGGSTREHFELPADPALVEALIIGFTRMGILHNLARLSFGASPEGAAGGIREWIEVGDFRLGGKEELTGGMAIPVSFSIFTNGQRSSEATLWISDKSGLPVLRSQTVQFSDGPMHVTEKYAELWIGL
jgi:hypothetical protein